MLDSWPWEALVLIRELLLTVIARVEHAFDKKLWNYQSYSHLVLEVLGAITFLLLIVSKHKQRRCLEALRVQAQLLRNLPQLRAKDLAAFSRPFFDACKSEGRNTTVRRSKPKANEQVCPTSSSIHRFDLGHVAAELAYVCELHRYK